MVSAGNEYWEREKRPDTAEKDHLSGSVFYRHWRAEDPVRAVILLAYGLGEHSGKAGRQDTGNPMRCVEIQCCYGEFRFGYIPGSGCYWQTTHFPVDRCRASLQ